MFARFINRLHVNSLILGLLWSVLGSTQAWALSVEISWQAPTQFIDGSSIPAGVLARCVVRYGTSSTELTGTVEAANCSSASIRNLKKNRIYYFSVSAITVAGMASSPSEIVSLSTAATSSPLDFDNDGLSELVTHKIVSSKDPATGKMAKMNEFTVTDLTTRIENKKVFGKKELQPMLADVDGDGITDFVVVNQDGAAKSSWKIEKSSDGQTVTKVVGSSTETKIAGCNLIGGVGKDLVSFNGKAVKAYDLASNLRSKIKIKSKLPARSELVGCGPLAANGMDALLFSAAAGSQKLVIAVAADGTELFRKVTPKFDKLLVADLNGDGQAEVAVLTKESTNTKKLNFLMSQPEQVVPISVGSAKSVTTARLSVNSPSVNGILIQDSGISELDFDTLETKLVSSTVTSRLIGAVTICKATSKSSPQTAAKRR